MKEYAVAAGLALAAATTPVSDLAAKTVGKAMSSLEPIPQEGTGNDLYDGERNIPFGYAQVYLTDTGVYVKPNGWNKMARVRGADPKTFECFMTRDAYKGMDFTNWCTDGKGVWDSRQAFKRLDHVKLARPDDLKVVYAPSNSCTAQGSTIVGYYTPGTAYDKTGKVVPLSALLGERKNLTDANESRNKDCIGD